MVNIQHIEAKLRSDGDMHYIVNTIWKDDF